MKKRYGVTLTARELECAVWYLNELRNYYLSEGKYATDIGLLMLKFVEAKPKKSNRTHR